MTSVLLRLISSRPTIPQVIITPCTPLLGSEAETQDEKRHQQRLGSFGSRCTCRKAQQPSNQERFQQLTGGQQAQKIQAPQSQAGQTERASQCDTCRAESGMLLPRHALLANRQKKGRRPYLLTPFLLCLILSAFVFMMVCFALRSPTAASGSRPSGSGSTAGAMGWGLQKIPQWIGATGASSSSGVGAGDAVLDTAFAPDVRLPLPHYVDAFWNARREILDPCFPPHLR